MIHLPSLLERNSSTDTSFMQKKTVLVIMAEVRAVLQQSRYFDAQYCFDSIASKNLAGNGAQRRIMRFLVSILHNWDNCPYHWSEKAQRFLNYSECSAAYRNSIT